MDKAPQRSAVMQTIVKVIEIAIACNENHSVVAMQAIPSNTAVIMQSNIISIWRYWLNVICFIICYPYVLF